MSNHQPYEYTTNYHLSFIQSGCFFLLSTDFACCVVRWRAKFVWYSAQGHWLHIYLLFCYKKSTRKQKLNWKKKKKCTVSENIIHMMTTSDTYITVECNLQKYYTKNKNKIKGEQRSNTRRRMKNASLFAYHGSSFQPEWALLRFFMSNFDEEMVPTTPRSKPNAMRVKLRRRRGLEIWPQQILR